MTNIKRVLSVTFFSVMVVAIFGSGIATAAEDIRIGFTPPITGHTRGSGVSPGQGYQTGPQGDQCRRRGERQEDRSPDHRQPVH